MRTSVTLLVCCAPLLAQFDNLVTNDDGSVLYFSSSLRMRDTDQFTHRKLFVADGAGVRLYLQRPLEVTTSPDATWPVSTYYSLESVALSGDGSTIAVVARRDCYGGSGCLPTPKYRTEIGDGNLRGRLGLSRSGRYGLTWGDGSMIQASTFTDFQTGQTRTWIGAGGWTGRYGRRQISSTGTAAFLSGSALRLFRFDSERTIDLPGIANEIVIDDNAHTAVYLSDGLYAVKLTTGEIQQIAPSGAAQPCLSNDGRFVLFLGPSPQQSQMLVIDLVTGTKRLLTGDPAGIREIVLSGNGRTAYAVTGAGRLIRVAVETGVQEELIGQTARIDRPFSSLAPNPVPGSAFTIRGRGFSRSPLSIAPPLPRLLNGLEVLVDGIALPVQTVEPERIIVQVPWEISTGRHTLQVRNEGSPVFESESVEIEIPYTEYSQFETSPVNDGPVPHILAAHGDFSRLVTRADPARPSEIVHFYMTGLGQVDPMVATGMPAPSNPPSRLVAAFTCTLFPLGSGEVLFAGLAPGMAGYYQVSVRIPTNSVGTNGSVSVSCGASGMTGWLPVADATK